MRIEMRGWRFAMTNQSNQRFLSPCMPDHQYFGQHSLANAKLGESFILHIFTDNNQTTNHQIIIEPACSNWRVALAEVASALSNESNAKRADRAILEFKCKNCNGEFASLHLYECHQWHQSAQGTLWGDESSKLEITFAGRAGLAFCILRQHSQANEKLGESFTLHIISSNNSNNHNNHQKNCNHHQIIIK